MSENNPWKTVSSRTAYQNSWITVREDQVIRPDGKPGIYGVVETRIATGVVALTPKNEIYLVGQFRYPTQEYSWEIIEGGTDPGENPLEAAKRELREEAGLIAAVWNKLGGEIHLSNCHSSEIGLLYIAQELTITECSPEATEILQLQCVPFIQALTRVETGEIKDGLSIIAILRTAKLLGFYTAST